MAGLLDESHIAKYVLSCLWLRIPFIIAEEDKETCNSLAFQLLEFVPEYRQLIACGSVPRSVEFSMRKPKILDTKDINFLKESLFSSFEEEKMGARPIQLIHFQSPPEIFTSLLSQLERGWFATTDLGPSDISSIIEVQHTEKIDTNTILFLKPSPDFILEEMLLEKVRSRPAEVARFIFQLKMSEINLIGNAILKEIESGVILSQVEIQELFEIDELTFHRTIDLLLSESKTDVRAYILMTPKNIQNKLDKMIELDGIYLCGAIENEKLVGLSKARALKISPSKLFTALAKIFAEARGNYNFGESATFAIELKCGKKILLVSWDSLIYCFFTDARVNTDLLLDKISHFL